MSLIKTKKQLAMVLSGLEIFDKPKVRLEQYATDGDSAATVLWNAFMQGDIEQKEVVDMGCGTGILGIGALLLGARKVHFIDIDEAALFKVRINIKKVESLLGVVLSSKVEVVSKDVVDEGVGIKVDTVVENPPFGIKKKHADRDFVVEAMKVADVVYSIHMVESEEFIKKLVEKEGFLVSGVFDFSIQLKQTMSFHKKKIDRVGVVCLRIVKK